MFPGGEEPVEEITDIVIRANRILLGNPFLEDWEGATTAIPLLVPGTWVPGPCTFNRLPRRALKQPVALAQLVETVLEI